MFKIRPNILAEGRVVRCPVMTSDDTRREPLRVSICILPEGPVEDILKIIELGDRLGYYAAYLADEIYHQDAWQLLAAAAGRTERIRLVPVTHIVLKQPTFMAQQLLTLDALSDGRAAALYSVGNLAMLAQHGVDVSNLAMIGRLREGQRILRSLLDTGKVDARGRFFQCSGLFTSGRPRQDRIRLTMGGIRGPRTFELAGEISDGLMTGCAVSEEALTYARDHFQRGAERARRDWRTLDLGAGIVGTISEDGEAAREVARIARAFHIPAFADEALVRHGIEPKRLVRVREAFSRGEVEEAVRLVPRDITDRLAMPVGTPKDAVKQLSALGPLGYSHAGVTLIDSGMVRQFGNFDVPEVPTVAEQLQLLHDRVLPHLSGCLSATAPAAGPT